MRTPCSRGWPAERGTWRVGLVGDTHGVVDARVLAALRGCPVIVHSGDVGDPGVLDDLAGQGAELLAVRGNNDTPGKWPAGCDDRLAGLPVQAEIALPGGVLVVVHGDRVLPAAQRHARLRQRYPQARAVLYGHSHRLVCDLEARPWVLNPGAAGRARTFGGPSCLLLHAALEGWRLETLRFPPLPRRSC